MNDTRQAGETRAAGLATGPTIYPATGIEAARSPWRLTTIAIILTLLIGVIGGGWLASMWIQQSAADEAKIGNAPPATGRPASVAPNVAPLAPTTVAVPLTTSQPAELSARIAALEERLSRISIQANSASGNAAKAEAILVAFAARRAIDRGLSLGAMEAQVRLRFGETQPNAVQSILSATARPVLQEDLIQRLDALGPSLMNNGDASWLAQIGESLSSLIIIRPANAPSQVPVQKLQRAQRALAAGRLDMAITEVESMPGGGSAAAQSWLNDARRLHDARRALDLIEAAAIIEPGDSRGAATAR